MPSRMMDHQNGMFASPCFSGDLLFPGERQVGFWKMDALKNNQGMKTDAIASTPYRMPIVSSSLDKLVHVDSVGTKCFEDPEQKLSFNLQSHAVGAERALNRSVNVWSAMDLNPVTRSNLNVPLSWDKNNKIPSQYENGLFSSSLSEIFSKKVQLSSKNTYCGHSVDTIAPHCEEDEPFESLEEIEAQTIGNLLPDDDDLLAGVVDGIESTTKPNQGNGVEDLDFFSSVGGMELDDTSSVGPKKSEFPTNSNGQLIAANISFNGEHPFGEVPSRTLFVRNINNNVEDIELQALFEQYGDISTLYTACKHRGFVMISYFDIRAARNAMKALQNKPLRRRRLDIHYSIPKDNPSEKDVSQGTLVAFNLDPYASSEDIFQILSVYGEIKEIREDSHRSDQKFIEFYDIRAADKALHALNQSDIVEKKIKLEPSYPRGLRRSSMQSLPTDVEQKTPDVYEHQSSIGFMQGSMNSTNMENGTGCVASAGILSTLGSSMEHPICHEISSSVPNGLSSFIRDDLTNIQTGFSKSGYSGSQTNCDFLGMPTFNPHSLPKYNDGLANGIPYNADCSMPTTVNSLSQERIENTHLGRLSSSVEMCNGFATSGNASGSLVGHHYKWGGLNHHQPPTFMWQNSPSFSNGFSSPQNQPRVRGLPQSPSHMLNSTLPMNSHRVGSAPSVNPSLWDRQNSYQVGSPETSNFHQGPPGYMRLSGSPMHRLDFVPHNMYPHVGGNGLDLQIPSRNVGFHGHQQRGMMYLGRGQMNTVSFEHPNERAKSRRSESNTQADNKKQFELNIDHIRRGEDTRTTLMIKNIPNKYTSKMLMAAIDEHHRGTYDFIYLPIDFKNKCNVGYAFINLIDPSHIISFYETLNGKKWEKFNSEKVALLAYARIQGKASLVAHFQNSSLMNEDKRCRPILFQSDGNSVGDQVPCPMGVSIRSKPGRSRSSNEEDIQQESPPNVGSAEEYSCKDSCSGSRKESD